jgi:signal transduction histidine kinase
VIESTSRGALAEIRQALEALRAETNFAPAPGLDDLSELVVRAGSAGVPVELEVTADGVALPDGVGLAVYRIVQESLTNVVKHAAPAHCRASVVVGPGEVRVEVTDDGRSGGDPGSVGQGIIGMRERVAVYGGQFTAGPRPGGGFTVTARIPYRAAT